MTTQKDAPLGETSPVMFITYAYNEPNRAPVLDSSPTLMDTRKWTDGDGFVYRYSRQADGTYGNEQFIEGPRNG